MSLTFNLPRAYIPREFGTVLVSRIEKFNDSADVADQKFGHMHHLKNMARFVDVSNEADACSPQRNAPMINASDLQDDVVRTYSAFMHHARDIALFYAWCLKNISVLPRARKWVDKNVSGATKSFNFEMLHDPEWLRCELDVLRGEVFETEILSRSILTRDGARILRDDPDADTTFMDQRVLAPQVFHDWVEASFFRSYSLPLNLYPRTPALERAIRESMESETYCQDLIQKIQSGAMQLAFPGLSLDGKPAQDAQLSEIYKHVADHAATFTPSETARVIHLANAGSSRAGTGARGPVGNSQKGCTPR